MDRSEQQDSREGEDCRASEQRDSREGEDFRASTCEKKQNDDDVQHSQSKSGEKARHRASSQYRNLGSCGTTGGVSYSIGTWIATTAEKYASGDTSPSNRERTSRDLEMTLRRRLAPQTLPPNQPSNFQLPEPTNRGREAEATVEPPRQAHTYDAEAAVLRGMAMEYQAPVEAHTSGIQRQRMVPAGLPLADDEHAMDYTCSPRSQQPADFDPLARYQSSPRNQQPADFDPLARYQSSPRNQQPADSDPLARYQSSPRNQQPADFNPLARYQSYGAAIPTNRMRSHEDLVNQVEFDRMMHLPNANLARSMYLVERNRLEDMYQGLKAQSLYGLYMPPNLIEHATLWMTNGSLPTSHDFSIASEAQLRKYKQIAQYLYSLANVLAMETEFNLAAIRKLPRSGYSPKL